MIAYRFVNHEIPPLESLSKSFPYRMMVKLIEGVKLTRAEKNDLFARLAESGSSIRLMGWQFPFSQHLTEYWIRYSWGQIEAVWAPDKTSIRDHYKSRVRKIVEVA